MMRRGHRYRRRNSEALAGRRQGRDDGCFAPGLSSGPPGDGKTGRPGDCPSFEHACAIQPNHFRLNTDSGTSQGEMAKGTMKK